MNETWSAGLTDKERKAVYTMWESYYPYTTISDTTDVNVIVLRLSKSNSELQAIGRKIARNRAGIGHDVENLPNMRTLEGESPTMAKTEAQGKGHVTQPAPTLAAAPKKLSPEEQAKLDAEINANIGGKGKKKETTATPRSGAAPGGKTWVEWFREVIGVQGNRTDEEYGKAAKDAEAQYIELRKGEPAYSGEGGDKKLKRHAYHHRVLAMEAKAEAPAA